MGEPVKILDLAEKMIRLTGHNPYKEVKIEFTGLRPGEKMYEELLKDSETILKTKNNKIFIEKNNNGYETILTRVSNLKENVSTFDAHEFIGNNVRSYNNL